MNRTEAYLRLSTDVSAKHCIFNNQVCNGLGTETKQEECRAVALSNVHTDTNLIPVTQRKLASFYIIVSRVADHDLLAHFSPGASIITLHLIGMCKIVQKTYNKCMHEEK